MGVTCRWSRCNPQGSREGTAIYAATMQYVPLYSKKCCKNFLNLSNILLTISSQIHSHCQMSRPVDPIFDDLTEAVLSFENTEDRLLSRTIRVPQLQSLVNGLLSQPTWRVAESEIIALIGAAEELDSELADWASSMFVGWSYSVATNLNSMSCPELPTSCYIPREIHRYQDYYTARMWNLYRCSRLIIQSIILRATSWLCSRRKDNGPHPDTTYIEKVNRILVNDICASVPFLLGYDLAQLKRPGINIDPKDDKFIWPQSSMSKVDNSKHTGRFSLIWPLYLSCGVPSIPENQRCWMRAQLQCIAECGEPLAKLVSGAQTQTLLGRCENFRFDCV